MVALADGAHPRPLDGQAPPAQRHRAPLGTVPSRGPLRVVATLGTGQLVDLGGHQLSHDLQADRGRGRQ
jgi:hypothetical protein